MYVAVKNANLIISNNHMLIYYIRDFYLIYLNEKVQAVSDRLAW